MGLNRTIIDFYLLARSSHSPTGIKWQVVGDFKAHSETGIGIGLLLREPKHCAI
jgi:hypothetical protein